MQFIFWILFSLLEGIREGAHFSYNNSNYPFNIHKFFVPVRALFALVLLSWSGTWLDIIPYMLVFPFLHDGAYYQTRHYLDYPPYNFFSQSTSTTAKFSINFLLRTVFTALGIISYFLIRFL